MHTQAITSMFTDKISFNGQIRQPNFSANIVELPENNLERSPLQDVFCKASASNQNVSFNGYHAEALPTSLSSQKTGFSPINSDLPKFQMYG